MYDTCSLGTRPLCIDRKGSGIAHIIPLSPFRETRMCIVYTQ